MRLAVLIPARNEGPRLGRMLREVRANFPEADCIVVNSASEDDTVSVALSYGAEVVEQGSAGYAGALAAGYLRCVQGPYEAVLQIDGDGQHPSSAGHKLLDALKQADWVVGSRAGTNSPSPLPRRAARQLLALAVFSATGQRLGDVTSGYWALNRTALEAFAESFPRDVADANIRVLADRIGLELLEVPVEMADRTDGVSMHNGLTGVRNLGRSLWALRREAERAPSGSRPLAPHSSQQGLAP